MYDPAPKPLMLPMQAWAMIDVCRYDSRAWMLVRCISIAFTPAPTMASLSAMLVCVYAAALRIT